MIILTVTLNTAGINKCRDFRCISERMQDTDMVQWRVSRKTYVDGRLASLPVTLNNVVYNCLTPKLTAPADERSACDSWRSLFLVILSFRVSYGETFLRHVYHTSLSHYITWSLCTLISVFHAVTALPPDFDLSDFSSVGSLPAYTTS